MINFLLKIIIAFIAADRIDLLGGEGDFSFTPYLFCVAILLFVFVFRLHGTGLSGVKLFSSEREYIGLVSLFCVVIFFTALFSDDIAITLKKIVLLLFIIFSAWIVAYLLATSRDFLKILVAGCRLGLLINSAVAVLQILGWFGLLPVESWSTKYLDLTSGSIGSYVPRVTGLTVDPNRAGMIFCFYFYVIFVFDKNLLLKYLSLALGLLIIVLTFSKSAIISFVLMMLLYVVLHWRDIGKTKILIGILALSLLMVYVFSGFWDSISSALDVSFDFSSGSSSSSHVDLVRRGLDLWISSFATLFFGHGFGASGSVLYDLFGDSKYANFHSLYVTLLAECGIFVFFIYCLIYIRLFGGARWIWPVLLYFGVFNVFYQTVVEPLFWFVFALASFDVYRRRSISN